MRPPDETKTNDENEKKKPAGDANGDEGSA
jgi:hypothetical protein